MAGRTRAKRRPMTTARGHFQNEESKIIIMGLVLPSAERLQMDREEQEKRKLDEREIKQPSRTRGEGKSLMGVFVKQPQALYTLNEGN